MDFGVVLQTNPPASGVVAMMQRAEEAGFSYGWTWDSHVLWQEPFVIYSRILAATTAMTVGPMVTGRKYGFRGGPADEPAGQRRGRDDAAGRGGRLFLRLDVGLARALAGTVRHLLAHPGRARASP